VKSTSANFVAKYSFSQPGGTKIHSYEWTVSGHVVSGSNAVAGYYKHVEDLLRSIKLEN